MWRSKQHAKQKLGDRHHDEKKTSKTLEPV